MFLTFELELNLIDFKLYQDTVDINLRMLEQDIDEFINIRNIEG